MPDGIDLLSHPDDWDRLTTHKWVDLVRRSQTELHDENQRFQYQILGPTLTESRYRKDIHPESTLRYSPDARIFIGRLIRAPSVDELSLCERRGYFIKPPRAINVKLFTDEDEANILARGEDVAFIKALLVSVIRYEQKHPVRVSSIASWPNQLTSKPTQATIGQWKAIQAGSPGLPEEPPERLTCLDDIDGWWIDDSYFLDKASPNVHSAHQISTWLRSDRFVHPITKTLFGGPYGAK